MRRTHVVALLLLSLFAGAACSLPPVDYTGKLCPTGACPGGFDCRAGVCRPSDEPLADAGAEGQRLVFTTPARTAIAGACSGALTVEARDAADAPAPVALGVVITLAAAPSAGFAFFADSTCSIVIAGTSIAAGTSASTFYFKGVTVGAIAVTASSPGFAPASQAEQVVAAGSVSLAFTGAPQTVPAGGCSAVETLELRDAAGNAAPATTAVGVALTVAPTAAVAFFSDSACTTAVSSVTVAAAATQATFYFRGSSLGAAVITASATAFSSATQPLTVVAGGVDRLAFATAPHLLAVGVCSPEVAVQTRDGSDNAAPVMADTPVSLVASPAAGLSFFSDSLCANAVTSVTIGAGTDTASFYVRGAAPGAIEVTASAPSLTSASQTHTVLSGAAVQLGIVTAAQSVVAGLCSGATTIEAQDSAGNAAPMGAATTVNLSAAPAAGFTFFSDSACTTAITSVPLASGAIRATVYFRGTAAGTVALTASATALNAALQTQTITAGPAASLAFVTPPRVVGLNACSGVLTVEARDAFGNTAPAAAALTLGLAAAPATGFTFHADAACSAAVTSVSLPLGQAQASLYFKSSTAAGVTITASSGALTPATQLATISSGGPVSLVFSSAAQSLAAGACSGALVIESRDPSNAASPVASATTVTLAAAPSTGFTFYAGAGCAGAAVTTATIAAAASNVTVSFKGSMSGSVTVTASATGLNPATQVETLTSGVPTKLVFTTAAKVLAAGGCSSVATVQTRDAFDNVTPVTAATTLTLAAAPATGFAFYSDSACTTAVTTRSLAAAQSSASFYLRGTAAGAPTVTVSATGLTAATQTETVFPGSPLNVVFTTPARTAAAGVCSAVLTIEARDAFGNVAPVTAATSVALSATPSTGFAFYADAACTMSAITSSIPSAGTSASFYFKGTLSGPVLVTAMPIGLNPATQTDTVSAAAATTFVWGSIGSPQTQDAPFAVTVTAKDAFLNTATGFTGMAVLSIAAAGTVACVSPCTNGTTTAAFSSGAWSGSLSVGAPIGTGRLLTATSGTVVGTSAAFDVQAPPVTTGSPPLAKFTVNPAAVVVGTAVTFDAMLSSDYETAASALQVSWDFVGTATASAGGTGWTAWSTTKTAPFTFSSVGVYTSRLAVKDADGAIGFAELQVAVVAAASDLCVVNTTVMTSDGATGCTGPFGTDGKLSLLEAIDLANASATKKTITFSGPMIIVGSGSAKWEFTKTADVVAPTGVVLSAKPITTRLGALLLLSGLEFDGLASPLSMAGSGLLTVAYSWVHDGAGISSGGSVAVLHSRFARCTTSCVSQTGGGTMLTGTVSVKFSSFVEVTGVGLDVTGCDPTLVSVDVQSSLFARNTGKGISIASTCTGQTRVLHSTFHGNGVGISYGGNSGHVLRNNVFTSQSTSAASCGSATFTLRDHHLLFGNTSNGCLATDPSSLSTDAKYLVPVSDDFRLQTTSPAKDSALDLAVDVNGPGPGQFTGAGPDLGAFETW